MQFFYSINFQIFTLFLSHYSINQLGIVRKRYCILVYLLSSIFTYSADYLRIPPGRVKNSYFVITRLMLLTVSTHFPHKLSLTVTNNRVADCIEQKDLSWQKKIVLEGYLYFTTLMEAGEIYSKRSQELGFRLATTKVVFVFWYILCLKLLNQLVGTKKLSYLFYFWI